MNKITLISAVLIGFIASCNNPSVRPEKTGNSLIPRNTGINKGNAYSDLFLDSITVERFIARQQLSDSAANDIRSFYNARNFQFAWFCSDGLPNRRLLSARFMIIAKTAAAPANRLTIAWMN